MQNGVLTIPLIEGRVQQGVVDIEHKQNFLALLQQGCVARRLQLLALPTANRVCCTHQQCHANTGQHDLGREMELHTTGDDSLHTGTTPTSSVFSQHTTAYHLEGR